MSVMTTLKRKQATSPLSRYRTIFLITRQNYAKILLLQGMIPAKLREYENLHIVLWLLKDTCWVLDYQMAGLIMVIPTIGVATHLTWISRKSHAELFHNLAVVCWICTNSIWMTGEFFYEDSLRPFSTVFFVCGLIMVGIYYTILRPRRNNSPGGME